MKVDKTRKYNGAIKDDEVEGKDRLDVERAERIRRTIDETAIVENMSLIQKRVYDDVQKRLADIAGQRSADIKSGKQWKIFDPREQKYQQLRAELQRMEKGMSEELEPLDEAITRSERIKRGLRMRRKKRFLKRRRDISNKRMPSQDKVQTRARKTAMKALKKRLSKKDPANMSVGEKARVEARVKKMSTVLDRMTRRMIPQVKKTARQRISQMNSTKKESVTVYVPTDVHLIEMMNQKLHDIYETEAKTHVSSVVSEMDLGPKFKEQQRKRMEADRKKFDAMTPEQKQKHNEERVKADKEYGKYASKSTAQWKSDERNA